MRGWDFCGLSLFEKTALSDVLNHFFPGFKAIQSLIGRGNIFIKARFLIKNIEERKTMTTAHFKVIKVMGRGDFNGSRKLFGVCMNIANNRKTSIGEGGQREGS